MIPSNGPLRLILVARRVDNRCRMELHQAFSDQSSLVCHADHPLEPERVERLSLMVLRHIRLTNREGTSVAEEERFTRTCGELHNLLLPPPVREALRGSRAHYLLIRADEWFAAIPWEFMYDGGEFLCCKYCLGRQPLDSSIASASRGHRPVFGLSFLVVSDPTRGLPAASEEGNALYRMLSSESTITLQWLNGPVRKQELQDRLGWCDILHYCGHGQHCESEGAEPGWAFADGPLSPSEIRDRLAGGKDPPLLVFSNACGDARDRETGSDSVIRRLGSHAHAFLSAGSECVVGTLSEVLDESGAKFAHAFYGRVLEGERIGAALRSARAELRAAGPTTDLSWAQYVLYGDPTTSVFEEASSERTARTIVLVDLDEQPIRSGGSSERTSAPGGLDVGARELLQNALLSFPDAAWTSESEPPFLCAFSRPSDAARFCCMLHSAARRSDHGPERPSPLRLAVSSGEVTLDKGMGENAITSARGPSVDIARSLLKLVRTGQTLMVHSAFDDARAVLKDRDFPDSAELVWSNHGPYRLADLDDPLWICEMGEKGSAPLLAPVESAEARRLTLPDEEPVLGWRPSLEKSLPNAPDWVLIEKLGEGGFGEVWRIQNRANGERRVAKFCFQSERVRHLKREVSLIRLLRERIGKHPNIVQLHEVCFETPPYYIVMEDVAGKDFAKWFEEHREHPELTEQVRLEILARVADTLQSAHDAGVIHRDVKPSNILIKGTLDSDSGITVMLTDFGIGQAPGREIPSGSTLTGFTGTFSPTELRARSGSWLYMAPEVLVGQESSIRSDVYSLGVILYQIVHGEFNQPLPADWERGIKDPILAGDIRRCLARRPEDRYESAGEFARALRNLGERRIAQAIEETRRRTEARRRRLTFGLGVFSVFAMALTIALGSAWRVAVQARERERLARLEAERGHYHSQIHEAQRAIEDHDSWSAREILYKCPEHLRGWEWGRLAYLSNLEQRVFGFEDTEVYCMAQSRDGSTLACGGMDGRVRVWELLSGNLLWEFKAGEGRVIQLALDSDSTTLAVSDEAWVSIWDVNSHRRTGQFRAERPPVVELQFLPGRSLLASADSHECFCIRDLSKPGRPAMELGDVGQLRDLAITPDGSRMFAACHDHGLMIFNGQTFALEKALGEEGQLATSVTVDNAGGAFAVAFENRIRLGSVPSLDLSGAELRVPGPVESLCFFRDGRLLAYQTSMGSYGVIDLESRAERYTGRGAIGKTILISPLDNRVVVLGRDRRVREYRHDRDLDGIPLEGHQAFVSAYDFSSDGEMLATGSDDQTIRLWDTESGRNISTFISTRPIRCLAFLSENQSIVGGSPGGAVQQWDIITGQLIREIQTGASNITSICRHPAKDRFAISTSEGQVVVYERSTLEKVLTIVASNGQVSRVAFSPDGSRLATAGEDYLVKEWDSETGNLVRVFEAHTSPVNQVAFLADGERLASAGEDQRILIWNRETGECVGTMLDKEYSLFDLAVSPDSQRLFTRARLWDLNNFRPILDFGERHRILHRDGLLMVEGGVPTALRILPAFPWKDHDLSEDPTLSLEERVEEYRERYWQARGAPSK